MSVLASLTTTLKKYVNNKSLAEIVENFPDDLLDNIPPYSSCSRGSGEGCWGQFP